MVIDIVDHHLIPIKIIIMCQDGPFEEYVRLYDSEWNH